MGVKNRTETSMRLATAIKEGQVMFYDGYIEEMEKDCP